MSTITDKMTHICKLNEIVNIKAVKQTLYVVSDKNNKTEKLVYADDWFNNSDRVRSHYSKLTGVKFTDTRCCRIKNVK